MLADNEAQANALEIASVEAPELVGVHARQMERLEQTAGLDRALEGAARPPRCCRSAHAAGLRAHRRPSSRCCSPTPSSSCSARWSRPTCPTIRTSTPTSSTYFPPVAAHRLRRRARVAPAPPRDRGHGRRQRGREPGRHQLPVAPVRRDRAVAAGARACARRSRATCSTPPTRGRAIDALDLVVPAAVQDEMFLAVRRLVERSARWLVRHAEPLALGPTVERFRAGVQAVTQSLPDARRSGRSATRRPPTTARFTDAGVAPDLARAGRVERRRAGRAPGRRPRASSTTSTPATVARRPVPARRPPADSTASATASPRCRAPTAGRPRRAPRSATTSTSRSTRCTDAVLDRHRRHRPARRRASTPGWPSTTSPSVALPRPGARRRSGPTSSTSRPSPSSAARCASSPTSTDLAPQLCRSVEARRTARGR